MITAAPDHPAPDILAALPPIPSPATARTIRPADYLDYRVYLKDLYLARKRKDRRFSYRFIALKAGFGSVGFFSQIVHGKTNISVTTVLRIGEVFKMDEAEVEHFEALVNWNQAKLPLDREYFARRLAGLLRRDAKPGEDRPRGNQTHSSQAVNLSDEAFHRLRGEIADFRRRVLEIAEKDGGAGRDYQVNLRVQSVPSRV